MANVSKRPNGRWRARYRDEQRREHAKDFARKLDAERWLREQQTALDAGTWVDPQAGRVTFTGFYAEWSKRQLWEAGTRKAMDLAVRSTTFADVELRRIRASHVETWVKGEATRGLAPGTIKTRFVNVRSVFRAAVRDRAISRDPSVGVVLPRQRKREATMRIPSPEEVGALLDTADEHFVAFIAVCAFAGLRLGEAAALQQGDVDFLRRQLHVSRQVQRVQRREVDVRLPKYGSERTVALPDELLTILSRHVELGHRTEWLFAGAEALPPHQNTVGHRWRQTCKRAGVTDVRLHDLRHFYASGLIAAGCDVVTVQRALGHAKASTTLDTYMHLWPSAEDRTRAAAASLMAGVLPARADNLRTSEQ